MTSIVVEDNPDFDTRWDNTGGSHRDIQLEINQGVLRRRISSIVDGGTTKTLNLDSALPGRSLTVDVVSFLELVRLGSDVATFQHFVGQSFVEHALEVVEQ